MRWVEVEKGRPVMIDGGEMRGGNAATNRADSGVGQRMRRDDQAFGLLTRKISVGLEMKELVESNAKQQMVEVC